MSEIVHVWTKKEIEDAAAYEPEANAMLRTKVSVRLLKMLIDYAAEHGEQIELISAHGNLEEVELHFFKWG